MSFLRRGTRRRVGASRALVAVLSLAAFQTLAIVGAGMASAAGTCTYNPATDTINITIDAGTSVSVAVETAADNLDAESPPGAILFAQTAFGDYENGLASTQCGSASTSNTVAIIVLGQPSSDEIFLIDEESGSGQFPSTIAWAIDLGSNTVGGVDEFRWWSTDPGFPVRDDTVVTTNTSFDINGAIGELVGVEFQWLYGGEGDDTIDTSGVTSAQILVNGGNGDDWIAAGAADGDVYNGQGDSDTLSYGHRTTAVAVVNGVDAGLDANVDGDNDDAGDEEDLIDCFEVVVTGSGNDTIDDGVCGDSAYAPGDGDDDVTGDAGDTVDWSTSTAGMMIDPANGTATGQGADTFTGPTNFVGSAFDDTLIWDAASVTSFVGGDGVDTVDASAKTSGQIINLDTLDDGVAPIGPFTADSLENAIGGAGNDTLTGNDLRNRLEGNDGDDVLSGAAGNDLLLGGAGNDMFTGGPGADKVSFINSPNGVNVDMLLGFATGEGDDGFGDIVEIVVGSAFGDTITGGGGVVAINFLFNGRGGDDILTGSGSNDTLKGGGGNDVLRGVNGDDTLTGARGNDRIFGGPGVDVGKGGPGKDTCKGVEIKSSCGTPNKPKVRGQL